MKQLLMILRPWHWTKNMFIFAALIFSQKLAQPIEQVKVAIFSAIAAFICFSLAASATYIFNDIFDRKADRIHPEKSHRPLASGTVSIPAASFIAIVCAAIALIFSYLLVKQFAAIIILYLVLNILYTLKLKNMLILDVIIISFGFVLRAIAGAVVIGVDISPWLIICTFALCLFLGFGKRRSELLLLQENSQQFRETLGAYTPTLLDHMLNVTSSIAVVCFLLYTMDDLTVARFGTHNLVYTTPLVLYCVFRFSALIQRGIYAGPVELIIKDVPFQIGLALWVLSCVFIIYGSKLNIDLGITY